MNIRDLLSETASHAKSTTDRGKLFEEVCKIFFENDKTQQLEYDQVWRWQDWIKEFRSWESAADIGIDLVASMRHEPGKFCAIQCKFYEKTKTLNKADLNSFISASATEDFGRRILFDTTEGELGKNIKSLVEKITDFYRFSFNDLDQSSINWISYFYQDQVQQQQAKTLRPHQQEALDATLKGLEKSDRGQLIMACGTGKTLTGLRIAEQQAGVGKRILLLVPSLALMHQTIVEWSKDATVPLKAYAVCSDAQAGKRHYRAGAYDTLHDIMVSELVLPATTDAKNFSEKCIKHHCSDAMTVVYSTYQSIEVVMEAQKDHALPAFDLTICDEAHRTTGKLDPRKESNFVRVHSNDNIQSFKRLYMTATPKIYADSVKKKADTQNIPLSSMDDTSLFGEVFFHYVFRQAVEAGILSDYKVVVLAVDENYVARSIQRLLGEDNDLKLDLASRLLGSWRAMTKVDFADELAQPQAMRTALAFSNRIATSKLIAEHFGSLVEEYRLAETEDLPELQCEAKHIDGKFNAKRRSARLDWLQQQPKSSKSNSRCRILTNAKCLTEGVDVPALDAILFLEPRKSQLDVVQAVGRVMRKAPGKALGYVILPVVIPAGMDAESFLNQNKRFKVIWQILNALRSHDERMDATIHKSALGEDISSQIIIDGVGFLSEPRPVPTTGPSVVLDDVGASSKYEQPGLFVEEIVLGLKSQLVKRCGKADYWEDWASDIGDIARAHMVRINAVVSDSSNATERAAFDQLLAELRDDLNPAVSKDDTVELLAQHLVTGPVFDALFQGHRFTEENSVSKALQKVVETLQVHRIDKEAVTLDKFYQSVRRRAEGVSTAQGRQALITELYETFFRKAFRRTTDRLGIVYTPVEIVDFILHSVDDVLQDEFGRSISDEGVNVLDPFVGTGTFLTRLLSSKLIKDEDLKRKYHQELHANELVLLAYYIAGINIEAVYHESSQAQHYEGFEHLCLTDTFQMNEADNKLADVFPLNSARVEQQKKLDIEVIVGNPPWSAGQRSANDNNPNLSYFKLDQRIAETYALYSTASNKNSLYDSYIRAIRWASDRIGECGVIGLVTNGGWLEGVATDGLRYCLEREFTTLYIFNLRGNQRTSGEISRKEGGKVFGSGSRATVVISILVRNPANAQTGCIYYRDIGDYLNREDKLKLIQEYQSINGIAKNDSGWQRLKPNRYQEWINQRDLSFGDFMMLGDKKDKTSPRIFTNYSSGLATSRDAWCYNFSRATLEENVRRSIEFFNSEVERYRAEGENTSARNFVHFDPMKFKWYGEEHIRVERGKKKSFDSNAIQEIHYRPFTKTHGYFHRSYNASVHQTPQLFPQINSKNLAICVHGVGSNKLFSALIVNLLPDLEVVSKSQCFPLYLYNSNSTASPNLNLQYAANSQLRQSALTTEGLQHFQNAYSQILISEEDLFYFIYGLLHSPQYRKRFQNNFVKQLPRIPLLSKYQDFEDFCDAGRKLADLHLHYEEASPYPLQIDTKGVDPHQDEIYKVNKPWKFAGKRPHFDKTQVHYNQHVTLSGIPLEAYDYVVNGKPALAWVMERQSVKVDKASGIVNDANQFAVEARNNVKYPLELFQRVITVSLETMKIVRSLPDLDIREQK